MAPRFSDLFGGESKQTEAAGSTADALGKVGEAASNLGDMFKKDVGAPIQALSRQLQKNTKDLGEASRRGIISERAATAQAKSMNAALERVNKTAEEMSKGNLTGAKAVRQMNKETTRALKLLKEENKLTRSILKGEKDKVLAAKMAAKRAIEAARFELKASRIKSGESKIVQGGAGALHGLASQLPGSGGIGPSGFGGGAIDALGAAGPWGTAAAGVTKLLSATMTVDREAAIAATQRFLNYGSEKQRSFAAEIGGFKTAFKTASDLAFQFDGDVEAISSAITRIVSQTGELPESVAASFATIEKLRVAGLGSTDEISDMVIKRVNQTGKTMAEVAAEMEDINLMTKTLQADNAGKLVIQMDDFYKGVQDLADEMGSLVNNQKALAKGFAVNLKMAKNLTNSYTRNREAALGLTKALTTNYDEGFSIMNVRQELQAALQSEDKDTVANAKKLIGQLESGEIMDDTAARFAKELGITSDATVTQFRLEYAKAQGGGTPQINMLEAQFGKLTSDQFDLVKQVMGQVQPGQKLADVLPKLSAETRDNFNKAIGTATAAQADPAKLMASITKDILTGVSETIPNIMQLVVDGLGLLKTGVGEVRDGVKAINALIENFLSDSVDIADGTTSLLAENAAFTGEAAPAAAASLMDSPMKWLGELLFGSDQDRALKKMLKSGALFQKRDVSEEEKKAIIAAVGVEEGQKAIDQILKQKAQYEASKARGDAAKVTGVQINDMKPNARASTTGTADVTTVPVEQKGAAKTAEKVANVNKATAEQTRSQSPTN